MKYEGKRADDITWVIGNSKASQELTFVLWGTPIATGRLLTVVHILCCGQHPKILQPYITPLRSERFGLASVRIRFDAPAGGTE